ncbi:MAG: tetratricopeptide repeat protein [Cyclobacteriaceae bacterium]|nr:tetratricopeptide repeat protein [Cyclobacteriaceae bacterium]
MAVLPGFEYDIFISYRHNDNRSGWVSEFVKNLQEELATTIKEPVTVYFDSNPHDGLLETHNVDKSLEGKLRCLIFIPILSHTYCDPRSFAWNNEFLAFCKLTKSDTLGLDVKLANKNVASRILPIQIHDLDSKDQAFFESESGRPLRALNFIFRSQGVNRPLTPHDNRADNLNKTFYRDQLNKTANAIEQIIEALAKQSESNSKPVQPDLHPHKKSSSGISWFWHEFLRRNVLRAAFTYVVVALLLHQLLLILTPLLKLESRIVSLAIGIMLVGFPLATLLAWFYEMSPYGIIRTNSSQAAANPFPPDKKKPLTGMSIVSILLLMLGLQYVYFNYVKKTLINGNDNTILSIAVLPFENRSGNESDKYIADGITDDIINRLAIISKFRVTNRGRSQYFEGQIVPFDNIAKDLDVKILITGSVERHGNQIAVRAQMIDETNTYLWGNTFQRTTENMVAVQSEIALMIAEQLKIQLNDMEKTRLHLKATDNSTAYDYYLQGRSLYYKYKPASNDSAVELFKQAIALDPNYARAWAGLGDAYSQMNMRFSRNESWLDSSLIAGTKAIQIDSNLSEAYKALANAYSYKKLYDKAFPLLLKSVELNPTNDQAVGNLGTNYLLRGDLPEALRWEKKGVGMNPKNWIPYQLIGWIYRLLGDLGKAESWLIKSLELNPDVYDTYELLAYTHVAQGRKQAALNLIPQVLKIGDEPRALEVAGLIAHYAGDIKNAKTYFQRSIDTNEDYKNDPNTVSPIGLGQILSEEGYKVEADVYLSHATNISLDQISKGSQSYEPSFYLAAINAIRGNKEQSLHWVQKAIELNWIDYAHVLYGPYFIKYRNDPDFIKKVDLVRAKSDSLRKKAEEY